MFEVFTSVNSADDLMNCDEAISKIGSTFLYLIKRGNYSFEKTPICTNTYLFTISSFFFLAESVLRYAI